MDPCFIFQVFDCWFESGSMPYAYIHYPFENVELFEKNFPGHFIAEGLDQTRGWSVHIFGCRFTFCVSEHLFHFSEQFFLGLFYFLFKLEPGKGEPPPITKLVVTMLLITCLLWYSYFLMMLHLLLVISFIFPIKLSCEIVFSVLKFLAIIVSLTSTFSSNMVVYFSFPLFHFPGFIPLWCWLLLYLASLRLGI